MPSRTQTATCSRCVEKVKTKYPVMKMEESCWSRSANRQTKMTEKITSLVCVTKVRDAGSILVLYVSVF